MRAVEDVLLDLGEDGALGDGGTRFDGQTGTPLGTITEGFPDWATGFDFGSDGNVYVARFFDESIMKFDGGTGQWLGTFAINCFGPEMIQFGPGGDLYCAGYHGDHVVRYDGQSGAWKRSYWGNGLAGPMDIAFRGVPSTRSQ